MSAPRLRDGLRQSVLVFLGVRAGAFLLSLVGTTLIEPRTSPPLPAVPGWSIAPVTIGWHNLATALERQDAAWYLRIATHGYAPGDGSAAFFPLYPMAIHAVAWLPGIGPLGASLLVSNLAFLGALVMLHGLTRLEGMSDATARRTILFIAVFPTAFFFLAPYSESLFLLLSVSTFWFARRDRWGRAAVTGALAALTRSIGVLILPALVVEAILQSRGSSPPGTPLGTGLGARLGTRLGAALAVGIGPLAYFAYWSLRFHDPWAPYHAQERWGRHLTFPLASVVDGIRLAVRLGSYWAVDALVVGIVVAAVVAGVGWIRSTYLVYAAVSLLLPLSDPLPGRPLLSMPRFVVVIFPAFWVLALAVERRRLPESLVTATFAAGYGILALLFVNWWHIF